MNAEEFHCGGGTVGVCAEGRVWSGSCELKCRGFEGCSGVSWRRGEGLVMMKVNIGEQERL